MDTYKELMKEKDEKISQLERQLVELTEGHRQSAATFAGDYHSRAFSSQKGIFKNFFNVSRLKIILFLLICLGILAVGIWLFQGNSFKQDSVAFVERVQELATLATAEAYTKEVIFLEDQKNFLNIDLPGTKREVLLVVPATVLAGVDLKGVTSKDMVIHEDTKEIDITLPHAEIIQDPAIQMDKIQFLDKNGLFRADLKMKEGMHLLADAKENIREDAISGGLLDTAEKNAEKALKEFFKTNGYTVNVTFQ